jgi:hypothetical protein
LPHLPAHAAPLLAQVRNAAAERHDLRTNGDLTAADDSRRLRQLRGGFAPRM